MKPFVLRVFNENRDTRNVSISTDQYIAMLGGFKAGRYSGLEVRVKETNELLYFIPAFYCSLFVYHTLKNKQGQPFQAADLTPALEAMEADRVAS